MLLPFNVLLFKLVSGLDLGCVSIAPMSACWASSVRDEKEIFYGKDFILMEKGVKYGKHLINGISIKGAEANLFIFLRITNIWSYTDLFLHIL